MLCLVEHIDGIADRSLDLDNLAVDLVEWWKLDSLTRERIANFLNLLSDVITVPEDNDIDRSFSLICL